MSEEEIVAILVFFFWFRNVADLFVVTAEDPGGTELSFPGGTVPLNLIPKSMCQDPGGTSERERLLVQLSDKF